MARRLEGTVALGFVCDAKGCGLNAIWAPILCTPYLKEPRRAPIVTFTDVHVCHHHWGSIHRDLATDHMCQAIRAIADQNGGKPDFDRMFLSRIQLYHPDYHRFQEMAGLIENGDRVIKSDAWAPSF